MRITTQRAGKWPADVLLDDAPNTPDAPEKRGTTSVCGCSGYVGSVGVGSLGVGSLGCSQQKWQTGLTSGNIPFSFRICLSALSLTLAMTQVVHADQLLLRDLTLIRNRTISSFDLDGVLIELSPGDEQLISWDRIESGQVEETRQEEFDDLLTQVGEPLFRIRQRLRFEDYDELLPLATSIYPLYRERTSFSAYVVAQSLMWSRIAHGEREQAIEPFLRSYSYLDSHRDDYARIPGPRRLQFSKTTVLNPSLIPVWFDAQAAAEVLDDVYDAFKSMKHPRPTGAYVYVGSLAITAGDQELTDTILTSLEGTDGPALELKSLLQMQLEVSQGVKGNVSQKVAAEHNTFLPENRAIALYWLGQQLITQKETAQRQRGVLKLLNIPATYGSRYQELSAAALHDSMKTLAEIGDQLASQKLRDELRSNFAYTYYGRQQTTSSSFE